MIRGYRGAIKRYGPQDALKAASLSAYNTGNISKVSKMDMLPNIIFMSASNNAVTYKEEVINPYPRLIDGLRQDESPTIVNTQDTSQYQSAGVDRRHSQIAV